MFVAALLFSERRDCAPSLRVLVRLLQVIAVVALRQPRRVQRRKARVQRRKARTQHSVLWEDLAPLDAALLVAARRVLPRETDTKPGASGSAAWLQGTGMRPI